jgi:hypothetical protein
MAGAVGADVVVVVAVVADIYFLSLKLEPSVIN